MNMTPPALPELATLYGSRAQAALAESIVPFWWRAIDEQHGGVFNCWNNPGTHLVSRDKFTWSQGRFAWLWSRLAEVTGRGLVSGNAERFLVHAEKTVRFLREHAFLRDGRCAFLLSEEGDVKEAFSGAGSAPSIFADCFVAMGLAEFARVSGANDVLDAAWTLFADILHRIEIGDAPTHPAPTPAGFESHGLAMIRLNVALVIEEACRQLQDSRASDARGNTMEAATRVLDRFVFSDGRVAELRRADNYEEDTLIERTLTPGHALELSWMLLTVAVRADRADWIARANAITRFALERGWDEEHGGLLYFVDREGGPPRGETRGHAFEANIRGSWDAKLWWVHSEALYATLLSYRCGGEAMRGWFERLWEYSFRVFPQPNTAVGEWIQIRSRLGEPLERVVALPVKDPYHVARNLIQILELFAQRTELFPHEPVCARG